MEVCIKLGSHGNSCHCRLQSCVGMSKLLCPQSSSAEPGQSPICSALLPSAELTVAAHPSMGCSSRTLGCAHTQLTLCSATSEMLAKHLHCITDIPRGLSVLCLVHTDFLTYFDFLDFQGKSIRTNFICFFPLTTKGAKSFHKMFLSLLPSLFYDCNNC